MESSETLIKLLIIGESSVGKSCLLLRFAEDKFNESFLTTIGIDFKVRHVVIDDARIKLQIWDTAGQEKFRTITKAYYRGANGILLVFDVTSRDSFSKIRTWMASIKDAMTDPVDVILVGNKCDMERKVTKEEAQSIAGEYGISYFETSAKTGLNVESTFIQLGTIVKRRKDKEQTTSTPQPRRVEINKGGNKDKKSCC